MRSHTQPVKTRDYSRLALENVAKAIKNPQPPIQDYQILEFLLELPTADVNGDCHHPDFRNLSLLMSEALNGDLNVPVIKILLKHGADPLQYSDFDHKKMNFIEVLNNLLIKNPDNRDANEIVDFI